MFRKRDFGAFSPKWDVFIKFFPSELKELYIKEDAERFEEPEVMDGTKEILSSRYNKTNTHISSQRLGAWGGPTQVQSRQGPSAERATGHKLPPLAKKVSIVGIS